MADHGWNADGAAGGVATGNSDSDSSTGAAQAPAPNVVQFPGDWIGPLDELVPIDLEPPTQEHPRASSFWDGDATAVHEAVGAIGVAGPELGEGGSGGGGAGPWVGSAGPGATQRQAPPPVPGVSAWPGQRRRPSWLLVAGVVVAALLAGLAVLWFSHGGRAPGTSRPVTAPSAATVGTRSLKPERKPKPLSPDAKPMKHKAKPLSHKDKPAKARTKPSTLRPVTKHVTVTQHVTVAPSAPVTHYSPVRHETPVTTPAPVVVQHVVAAPPKKPATSHTTQRSHTTQSAPCVMSPDSGCLP
jgi:hypothetical protein